MLSVDVVKLTNQKCTPKELYSDLSSTKSLANDCKPNVKDTHSADQELVCKKTVENDTSPKTQLGTELSMNNQRTTMLIDTTTPIHDRVNLENEILVSNTGPNELHTNNVLYVEELDKSVIEHESNLESTTLEVLSNRGASVLMENSDNTSNVEIKSLQNESTLKRNRNTKPKENNTHTVERPNEVLNEEALLNIDKILTDGNLKVDMSHSSMQPIVENSSIPLKDNNDQSYSIQHTDANPDLNVDLSSCNLDLKEPELLLEDKNEGFHQKTENEMIKESSENHLMKNDLNKDEIYSADIRPMEDTKIKSQSENLKIRLIKKKKKKYQQKTDDGAIDFQKILQENSQEIITSALNKLLHVLGVRF
jgi:hypothetical protein